MLLIIVITQVELLQSSAKLVPKHKYCGLREWHMATRITKAKTKRELSSCTRIERYSSSLLSNSSECLKRTSFITHMMMISIQMRKLWTIILRCVKMNWKLESMSSFRVSLWKWSEILEVNFLESRELIVTLEKIKTLHLTLLGMRSLVAAFEILLI